jgi:hypothetical protein
VTCGKNRTEVFGTVVLIELRRYRETWAEHNDSVLPRSGEGDGYSTIQRWEGTLPNILPRVTPMHFGICVGATETDVVE